MLKLKLRALFRNMHYIPNSLLLLQAYLSKMRRSHQIIVQSKWHIIYTGYLHDVKQIGISKMKANIIKKIIYNINFYITDPILL